MSRADWEKVAEFYNAFQQEEFIPDSNTPPTITERAATLKLDLIAEEFIELIDAVLGKEPANCVARAYQKAKECDQHERDVVGAADATADLRYVIAGFELECGINSDAVFTEVHNSNMSKLDDYGNPILSDGSDGKPVGKILKGSSYYPPEIDKVLSGTKKPEDHVF